uniref:X-linked retinitis pigmentosa GTPase regulator-like n=1 Tax=Cyprinodon variegatus TaxID=28743 RepID=A0A3Q2CH90_CYPVA
MFPRLSEDDVYSFGLGQFGQLGHGTFIFESRLPRPVEHFQKGRALRVSCGENHTAVVTEGGLLYTFGDGRHGKLGLGEENFTNQFKPTLCPRFLKYHVQAAVCGGCHMVVLARPRDPSAPDVLLEDDDVTEDVLERPYVELLGDAAVPSLQRSLSARVRRRERERSPDQFGTMMGTLPAGFLPVPPRLPPPELSHRKVLKGSNRQPNTGSAPQEQTACRAGSVAESLTDTDSVRGLGETCDFLNMTHVMKMDPADQSLTLSPLEKRKARPIREQSRKKLSEGRGSSAKPPSHQRGAGSARREGPAGLPEGGDARSSSGRKEKTGQNKENLLLGVEQRRRTDNRDAQRGREAGKATSKRQKPAADWKRRPEPGKKGSGSVRAGKESRSIRVKGKPSAGSLTDLSLTTESSQPIAAQNKGPRTRPDPDSAKRSKNERNRKEAASKKETGRKEASGLGLIAGAAALAAGGAVLVQQMA